MATLSGGVVHAVMDLPVSTHIQQILQILRDTRKLEIVCVPAGNRNGAGPWSTSPTISSSGHLLAQLDSLAQFFTGSGHPLEAGVFQEVVAIGRTSTEFGGLELRPEDHELTQQDVSELLFLVSAHLEALNSAERAWTPVEPLPQRPPGRRGMTLSEKIFAAHDIEQKGEVKPGDVIRIDIDWIIASELSWKGMERWYDRMGKPGIYRNDRFWLAGDHVVDPRALDTPKVQGFIESSERAKRGFKMTENQGMNYTIMHTEFCRERAQPGMFVIGSDSHTSSAGSLSCLSIGLGVADVLLPLVTGDTWFKIPETVEIRFINKPQRGISGKDVILYILKELKRKNVAAERVVEYTGPGLQYLSCDARFAIANMTAEFGGVTGIFVPDAITQDFVNRRKKPKYKSSSLYFRPDEDAEYVETHAIDLAQVIPFVARYPRPEDVVAVTELEGMQLQGCFIGACTTTEEDLVLAALVLEEAMRRGARPVKDGKRRVVPGSMPIMNKLRTSGLLDIYEQAGFEIGTPGCSYCAGMSVDRADKGETWLSSQNRNFEHRMGPGSFANLASAVTVAASSFQMVVTNPASLLNAVDISRVDSILAIKKKASLPEPSFVEPGMRRVETSLSAAQQAGKSGSAREVLNSLGEGLLTDAARHDPSQDNIRPPELWADFLPIAPPVDSPETGAGKGSIITGKVVMLPDLIVTDALAPNEAISQPDITEEQLGEYCLYSTYPDFRRQVKELGQNIVVAGEGFGSGSSREDAVFALKGAGVQCVIAKSFGFIYGRNQPMLGLLGFEMRDPRFWERVLDKRRISIDLDRSVLDLEIDDQGTTESFPFQLSVMQRRLMECGGAEKAFGRYGNSLWQALTAAAPSEVGNLAKKPVGGPSGFAKLEKDVAEESVQW